MLYFIVFEQCSVDDVIEQRIVGNSRNMADELGPGRLCLVPHKS